MSGLSNRERALKVASADLFDDAVGKYELASDVIPMGKTQAHRCCSQNDSTSFFNIGHVATLERGASRPHVTIALARLAGGVFIRLPEAFEDAEGLPMHVVDLVKEVGDCADRLRLGLADGALDERELAALEKEFDDVIEKAVQGRAQVRAMQGKQAAPVRLAAEG